MISRALTPLCLFCLFALAPQSHATTGVVTDQSDNTPVIMLSLDGFRHDYIKRGYSPNLAGVAATGLAATGLISAFPSSTFTNHYSIVTGLYPSNHRIIGNTFYDRQRSETYRISDRNTVEDGSWYAGNPLWVAVEDAGGIAASYFWAGTEADIRGIRPTHYRIYDGRVANSRRVEQVLQWLGLPESERPNLITLYFSDVDSVGHSFGPDSTEVNTAIRQVDTDLGLLLEGLRALPFAVNLIVTSDHGMSHVDPKHIVYLSDWINIREWNQESKIISGGAYIYFYSDNNELISTSLSQLRKAPGLQVYPRGQFPAEMRLGDNDRTPDMIATVDAPGYLIVTRPLGGKPNPPAGAHGYLPSLTPSMQGIFIAQGPGVRSGQLTSVANIHIYPFVMSLLGLDITEPIDGDPEVLAPYLNASQ